MPGGVLTGPGFVGLFGKLPAAGDFVARGLPEVFRARWDDWLTRHVVPWPEPWPEGGLLVRLASGTRTASGLVLPSRDAVGRRFPLSGLLVLDGAPAPEAVEAWCRGAAPALAAAASGALGADALWAALDDVPRPAPDPGPDPATAPLLLWTRGRAPISCGPDDPGEALRDLLSSRGSPSP